MSLLAMKKGNNQHLWSGGKTFTPCAARTIIFQRENLNYLLVCFTQCTLFFSIRLFSIASLFAVHYLWSVCNKDKCCVVTHHRTFASLGLFTFARIAFLLLLESKQAISITLFGRRTNNVESV